MPPISESTRQALAAQFGREVQQTTWAERWAQLEAAREAAPTPEDVATFTAQIDAHLRARPGRHWCDAAVEAMNSLNGDAAMLARVKARSF